MKKNQLEFYRVIFTLGICIYHARGFLGLSFMQNGYLLVEFFFILSGYFLFTSFKREDHHSSLKYIKKRLLRLYPEYLVAALLAIVAMGIVNHDFNLSKAFNELLLVQNTGLFHLGGYNYPCWYISTMLLAGVIIYGLMSFNEQAFLKIGTPIIVFCGYCFILSQGNGLENWSYVGPIAIAALRAFCGMTVGVGIGALERNKYSPKIKAVPASIIEIFCIALISLGLFTDYSSEMLTIVAFGGLVYISASGNGIISRIVNRKWISTVGDYSYSVYLNHGIVLSGLLYIDRHIVAIPSVYLKLALYFVILIVYSVLSHVVITKIVNKIRKEKVRSL